VASYLDLVPSRARQLHFVTGKGGVGKSLVSVALARRFVDAGEKTLLVQVHARDAHGPLLQLREPVPDDLVEVERNLTVVNLNPTQATREYALMTLKLESVYRAVFENRVTKTFLRFVPSLNELTMMGKLWFHAEEKDGLFSQAPRFRRIVVDCPSTGHALKLFAVSRVLTDMVRVGPMVEKTRAMSAVWRDANRSAVHVVTLPEELPVNETIELIARLKSDGTAPVGSIIVNQLLPQLFKDPAVVDVVPDGPVKAVAVRRVQREARERSQRSRVDEIGLGVVEVPHLQESPLTPAHVARVAALLGGIT
jgi:anion-transporting  ArsA/GET3 family ATPase